MQYIDRSFTVRINKFSAALLYAAARSGVWLTDVVVELSYYAMCCLY